MAETPPTAVSEEATSASVGLHGAFTPEQLATLGPTANWTRTIDWREPGIGYLILLQTVPPAFGHVPYGGTELYFNLASFAPLDGYGYLLPRVPLELRHTAFWAVPPVSFTGIIIYAPAGVTGTVTAIK